MDITTEAIRARRSVRTFDGRGLSEGERALVEGWLGDVANPFGVPVELRLVRASEHGATSRVIRGADDYVLGTVSRGPHAEPAFGYVLERLVLRAQMVGLGTTWLAGTIDREAFERVAGAGGSRVMPATTPVGHPAERPSALERVMRSRLRADERRPFGETFFSAGLGTPLSEGDAGDLAPVLQMVRLAPSAENRQPWRVVVDGRCLHLFEHRTIAVRPMGDVQGIDMGIAMLHLEVGAAAAGLAGSWVEADPGIPTEDGYVASYLLPEPVALG